MEIPNGLPIAIAHGHGHCQLWLLIAIVEWVSITNCIGNGQWTWPLAMAIGNPLGIFILALILLAVILQNDLAPYRAPTHSGEWHKGKWMTKWRFPMDYQLPLPMVMAIANSQCQIASKISRLEKSAFPQACCSILTCLLCFMQKPCFFQWFAMMHLLFKIHYSMWKCWWWGHSIGITEWLVGIALPANHKILAQTANSKVKP